MKLIAIDFWGPTEAVRSWKCIMAEKTLVECSVEAKKMIQGLEYVKVRAHMTREQRTLLLPEWNSGFDKVINYKEV